MPDHHGFTRKRFQPRDIALLWARAGGICSHPECHLSLLAEEQVTDPAQTLGEMAHIVGHSPDGPRGDANFPRDEIDLYENLILLCAHHHTLIDKQWQSHPTELLARWKGDHEAEISQRLRDSRPSGEDLTAVTRPVATHQNPPTATFTTTGGIPVTEPAPTPDLVFAQITSMTPHDRVTRGPLMMRAWRRAAVVKLRTVADRWNAQGIRNNDDSVALIKDGIAAIAPWLVAMFSDGLPGLTPITPPQEEFLELLHPTSWDPRQSRTHRGLPLALVYFAQVWLGAARIKVGKLQPAIDFAASPLPDPYAAGHTLSLAFDLELLGALRLFQGHNPIGNSFTLLLQGFDHWPWLAHFFDDSRDYQVACTAYLLALHLNEFAAAARQASTSSEDRTRLQRGWPFQVPPLFLRDDDGLVADAFGRLQRQNMLSWICDRNNIGTSYLNQFVPGWKQAIANWLASRNYAPFAEMPYLRALGVTDDA